MNKSLSAILGVCFSISGFAYSVKTIDCYDQLEMAKKKKKRTPTISLISAKINKKYKYALKSSLLELTTLTKIADKEYESSLLDKALVSVKTDAKEFYSIRSLDILIDNKQTNKVYKNTLKCFSNFAANKIGAKYQKSHRYYYGFENDDFYSLLSDVETLNLMYKQKKSELKKGNRLGLKDKAFSLKTVKESSLDETKMVACRVKGSRLSRSTKDEVVNTYECLVPRFKVVSKKSKKRKKIRRVRGSNSGPILQCESGKKRKTYKPKAKKSQFHKRRYNLERAKKPRRTNTKG
ncbi:MAG: hypothetical protein N4A33_11645 [Bacteriovoracaceae bacterium]|jgi:hypothetical protein|nr:hypothetical protein [Bacteriovoracaceae bacterium]